MALTCPNGHVNDEGNRFCEQCGAPLQQPQADVVQPVVQTTAPAGASSSTCPVCGQENVPGTAFCDNCGTALPPPMPASEEPAPSAPADAALTSAPADASGGTALTSAPADTSDGATVTCPQCGTANDAANRFCDNCGASLSDTGAAAQPDTGQSTAAQADAGQVDSAPVAAQPDAAVDQSDASAQSVDVPAVAPEESAAPAAEATPPAPDEEAAPAAIDPTLTAPEAPPASATTDSSADRQRLEEEIRTQQQVVSQLEQMQASFGAATPAAVVQGLEEARKKLAQAEGDLQALPAAQPAADPVEVARLEEEIRTQQQVVSQLEQMQASFGAATPAAVVQGLEEARKKLAQAEGDLQALTGGSATSAAIPASAQSQPAQVAQPATPEPAQSQPAQPAAPAIPSQPVDSAAPVVVPATGGTNQLPPAPAQPQASGPRFESRDGAVLSLPRTGGEIVIGRDDPISGIHPDVDLTPHGGEAGGVSRRHAVLRESSGQWLLTDLNSTNYTRIDGNRLSPDTPTPLNDGARVQFGRLEFDFRAA